MPKKSVHDSASGIIEKHDYLILVVVLAITLIFAAVLGFGRIDPINSDPKELARLMASIAFPMTGIMIFVSTQSLGLRQKYTGKNRIDYIATVYTKISVTSAITLVGSAITGLFSLQYFKSGGDIWLVIALYLFLSIITLLIVNTVFFTIYALGKTVKNMRHYLR